MLLPINELEIINKAVKKDKALPEGGVWRTIKGHKIYIKDGEILAGHVPGVTDKADFKKLVGKKPAATTTKKTSEAKKPAAKKTTASEGKKTKEAVKPAAKKTTKAKTEAAETRKKIDALAGENAKAEAKIKKKTVKEAQAESKKATDEALAKPNAKTKAGKAATKKDLDKVVKDTAEAKKKLKPGKGATKADLDQVIADNAKNKKTPKPVTKEDLDEMFGLPKETKPKKTAKAKKEEVAVIRSEKQTKNEVAYDVGKKIGGARKDMAAQQKAIENLMGRKSGQSLEELEDISPELAQKHCVKKNLLPPVDFKAEHDAGTDINVAMTKQLIYDRILPKPSGDTKIDRMQYMEAIRNLQRSIEPIKSFDELKEACRNLGNRMKMEDPKYIKNLRSYIDYEERQLADHSPMKHELTRYDRETRSDVPITLEEWKARKQNNIKEYQEKIKAAQQALTNPYSPLGDKLLNFFTDYESRNRTFDTVAKKKLAWDTYFKEDPNKDKPKPKRGEANKIKWERQMPAMIQRKGGRTSSVEKPEDMVKNFKFSGVEFGNWVDDSSGNFHMKKCAEAFMDLADIIGVKDKDVSLNGKLSMAFGARGQGFALAHYEPASKAINITKEGGAGTLAHEWGHAMDNILYQASVGHSSLNYGSDGLGELGSSEVKAAYKDVMHAIMIGDGLGKEYVENKNKTYYSYHRSFREAVQNLGIEGAIKQASDMLNSKHQSSIDYYNGTVRRNYGNETADKYIEKENRKHKMAINDMIQEMAYHHEKLTGEKLDKIPMYTGRSQYYSDSSAQSKSSDYWTSNREMFARAFENYIEGKMKSGKVKNDYLVHGTYVTIPGAPAPYPQGKERDDIHKAFDVLMKHIVKSGDLQKGMSYDLEKGIDYEARLAAMQERRDPEGIEGIATGMFNEALKSQINQRNRNAYNVPDASEVFFIPVNRLKCEYQTEAALNFDKIRENVEKMKDGNCLMPVVIGYDYDVHDGHHRIEASKIMNYTHVPCTVGGSNEIDIQRAKEAYAEVWKSIVIDVLDPKAFPYEATGLMFRGVGQKELDFIKKEGYIQSKGKGNDGDQGCAVTCFTPLFTQAEGYARSQYDLYHEKQAYVLAVECPLASEENELGEIEVAGKIPVDMIRGILAVGLQKSLEGDITSIDLTGEKQAILDYSERIKGISDPKVKAVIAEILKDEKNHAHNLKCIIAYINGDKTALNADKLQKSFEENEHPRDNQGRFRKKDESAVQNTEKRMYSSNERGNQSDPQNNQGSGNSMKNKGADTNGKNKGTAVIRGNAEHTGQTGQGSSGRTGEKGLGQEKGRSASEGFFLEYSKTTDHKAFHSAISQAKSNNDHGAFVDLHDVEDYSHDTLLMSPQGGAGVAITSDGNIISVFKDPASNEKRAMHSIMLSAIQNGGKKLDCFDGYLPINYARYGMVPVAKLKFNREYAPEGWNFERDGEPAVVFMHHNGDSFEEVLDNFGSYPMPDLDKVPFVEEYEDGMKAQEDFLAKLKIKKEVAATA